MHDKHSNCAESNILQTIISDGFASLFATERSRSKSCLNCPLCQEAPAYFGKENNPVTKDDKPDGVL
ncbi:uncharacterized protein PHALS_05019 [Plasmopara halstedii]|uniref:Uncharacterized protein n=1 Tax=Plasmopara halstedii TaxID=4781 RepID=A0A0P1AAP2_PLAHL|nr:uncharacterized protein PHALS_05019 [Plasmopara halstedii]CEG37425.1 hypothetical protein PHALS_05019 [Plasmopara halstedii]|eukprot:XP_024573794.1 hypothetical protein PHALS_05019 [Plasmopara halstedii]